MDIKSLYKEGHSIKAIARQTGRSRKKVSKGLKASLPDIFKRI